MQKIINTAFLCFLLVHNEKISFKNDYDANNGINQVIIIIKTQSHMVGSILVQASKCYGSEIKVCVFYGAEID